MPVVRSIEDFDHRSGHVFERAIFNNRLLIVIACALLTVLLGFQATKLAINAGFEKMIPHGHAYIKNYLESRGSLRGLGNSVRVVVENTDGDIFDPAYLEVLKQVNDELFLMPDVDRAWMKSIWTPAVRWSEVNEEGFVGGPVMPDNYDGTPDVGGCAQAQHPPRQHRRQPGGQRLPFEHGVRAPARAQCGHRQAAGLPRVLADARSSASAPSTKKPATARSRST